MNNQEVLTKAIQKAIDGGWTPNLKHSTDPRFRFLYADEEPNYLYYFLFSHDFAKALWGGNHDSSKAVVMGGWKFHLQQMVVADDPIAYLAESIK